MLTFIQIHSRAISFCFFSFFCETCGANAALVASRAGAAPVKRADVLLRFNGLFSCFIQRCPKWSSVQHLWGQRRDTAWSPTSSYLFLLGDLLLWFGDDLLLFGQDHLDVAGRAHVGVDAAVSAIRAPPHLGGLVDLDVFDDQRVHIQPLRTKPSRKPVRTRVGQICLKS